MLTTAWTPYRPHKRQRELWKTKIRFPLVPAGRGSGKTDIALKRLVRYLAVKKPWTPPKYFYAGPTHDQAKRIAWDKLKSLTPSSWIDDISESHLIIKTVFKSQLHIIGLDKPQRIEGDQWDGGIVDENSDIKPGTFRKNILPALTHKLAWCWRIGIPKRQGCGAAEFRENCELANDGKLDESEVFTWPSSDILSEDVLNTVRSHMTDKDFNEQFNAQFETSGGGIFYAFDKENKRECKYNPNKRIIVGQDFNVNPMCWVLCHRYDYGLEVFGEVFLRNANTYEALNHLYARYSEHRGGFLFIGDASAKARKTSSTQSDFTIIFNDARFKLLKREIIYPQSNPHVEDRFAATNTLFRNANGERRCFVDIIHCPNLVKDIINRSYKESTREVDNSNKEIGHMTDALGYVIFRLYPLRLSMDGNPQFHIPQSLEMSNY